MIVNRMEWQVKNGMLDTACKLLREEDNATLAVTPVERPSARIYTSMFGPGSRVAMEWTYPSIQEGDADGEAWHGTGRVPAFLEKWNPVTDKLISNEIYDLHSSSTNEESKNTIAVRWLRDTVIRRHPEYMDSLDEWIVKKSLYTARVMTKKYGMIQGVTLEVEYADLTDYQTQLHEWSTQPGIEKFWEIFNETTRPIGSTQVWWLWA